MKLLIAVPAEGSVPLLEFFGLLDEKQRQKLLSLFALLLQSPAAVMREPYVKHFCIERYQALYELRAKSKNLVRIIFTLTDDGDILFLTPFIKRHKRNTMQALDRSLDCLTHIRDGSCSTQELSIKFFLNGGITVRRNTNSFGLGLPSESPHWSWRSGKAGGVRYEKSGNPAGAFLYADGHCLRRLYSRGCNIRKSGWPTAHRQNLYASP